MHDVQDGLGLKNMCDLIKEEIQRIHQTKDLTKKTN